jgi:ATP-binding protein involved in chromosome partitioning
MSYYEVNGHRDYIFGKDGGKNLAKELKVPFIGEVPIKTEIRERADNGQPVAFDRDNDLSGYYTSLAEKIAKSGAVS